MKKVVMGVLISAALLGLGACSATPKGPATVGNQAASRKAPAKAEQQAARQKAAKAAKAAQATKASEKAASTSRKLAAKTPWDRRKAAKLAAFMKRWAPTMGQRYVAYDGTHPLKVATGMVYPQDLDQELVDEAQTKIAWAPTGKGNATYNVVAIYNYDGTEPPLPNRITYFFAFRDGQPVALVDQSRDGQPSAAPTKNTTVQSSFATIATGGTGQAKATLDPATAADHATKKVGLMLYALAFGKGNDITALWQEPGLAVYTYQTRLRIDAGHAVTSLGFEISGDAVHYWRKDASSGKPTAEQPEVEHTISLKALTARFGATTHQKQALKQAIAAMPAITHQY
ncbi:DUF4767 domain-containing protein [Lacticaseibacillus suihuaensis]